MKWFKHYAIGCLIALLVLSAMEKSARPDQELQLRALLTLAAVWPITAAIVVGGSIGEVASDGWDAEKTAKRLSKS